MFGLGLIALSVLSSPLYLEGKIGKLPQSGFTAPAAGGSKFLMNPDYSFSLINSDSRRLAI